MVVIRLARRGAKKQPFYDVVVADSRRARGGRFIEKLGYFNPVARGQALRIDLNREAINEWMKKGAQLSERVQTVVKDFDQGFTSAKVIVAKPKKPKVEAEPAAEVTPTEGATAQ